MAKRFPSFQLFRDETPPAKNTVSPQRWALGDEVPRLPRLHARRAGRGAEGDAESAAVPAVGSDGWIDVENEECHFDDGSALPVLAAFLANGEKVPIDDPRARVYDVGPDDDGLVWAITLFTVH